MSSKFKVGDRVKFSCNELSGTGTVEKAYREGRAFLIYMDNGIGHGRDNKCWWVTIEKLTLLKSKTKRFL